MIVKSKDNNDSLSMMGMFDLGNEFLPFQLACEVSYSGNIYNALRCSKKPIKRSKLSYCEQIINYLGNFNMKVNTGQQEVDGKAAEGAEAKSNQNNTQNVSLIQVTNYLVAINDKEEDAAMYFKFKYDIDEIIPLDTNQSYQLNDNKYIYFSLMVYKAGEKKISLLPSPLDLSNKNSAITAFESSEFIRNVKMFNTPAGKMIYVADEMKFLKECQIEIVNNIPKISERAEFFVHPYFLGEGDFSISSDGALFNYGD